jgi:hypothetical protein
MTLKKIILTGALLFFSYSILFCQEKITAEYLEKVFRSHDQSVLSNNYLVSHDPTPHAWEYFTHSQSPIGRVLFPDVMAIHVGHVYTLGHDNVVQMHHMKEKQWVPWILTTKNDHVQVERTINEDLFISTVQQTGQQKGVIMLQVNKYTDPYYRFPKDISIRFDQEKGETVFQWNDFYFNVQFRGAEKVMISQEPEPLLRAFAGFDDVQFTNKSMEAAWERNGIIWIAAYFDQAAEVIVKVGKEQTIENIPSFAEAVSMERERWVSFFNNIVPKIHTNNKVVRDTWYFAWKTVWGNYNKGGSGSTPHPYFAPTRIHYSSQWYWDDAYISILLRNLKDPQIPYLFLKNFSKAQHADGGIAGSLPFANALQDPLSETTTAMQPPLVGITLQLLKDKPGWPKDIKPVYDMFLKNAQWHYGKARDTDQDGLVEYHSTYDSSADMSPRFTPQLLSDERLDGPIKPTESVEYNVWMVLLWDNLAEMAQILGDRKAAREHTRKARKIEGMIHDMMWNEEDGFYYDLDAATKKQIKVMTPYGFNVMLLKNGPKDHYKRMVEEHLLNPEEFWGEYPVPTVPYNHPDFDPMHMWMGPVWINCNWLVIEGLRRQGFNDIAKELAEKTVHMVGSQYINDERVRSPQIYEWYQSPDGKPLGNEHFSWSCLVNDLILNFLNVEVK